MIAVNCQNVKKYFYTLKKKGCNRNSGIISSIRSCFAYEKKRIIAVNGIDFTINKGEIFGILGANGSGKSTLIRIISTLLYPDEGNVVVFGKDVVREEKDVRKMINRVSVEAAFFKKLSAWENLSYTSRLYGLDISKARSKALSIMERIGFSGEKMNESIENLSRGNQQKVAIARALLTEPFLLLLDEPTTGLDPRSKRQVQEFVKEVNMENGITALLTTHDMNEAERLCHRVGIMREGRLVAVGTPSELKEMVSKETSSLEDVFLKLAEEDEGND